MPPDTDLLKGKVTDDELKSITLADIGRAVNGLATQVRDDKTQIAANAKTYNESFAEFEKRLNDLLANVEKIKNQYPPDPLVNPIQGEYATRRGGLFRRGAPAMDFRNLVSLSPNSKILRGSDSEIVKDFQDAWDSLTFKYQLELFTRIDRDPNAALIALQKTRAVPDFKRMEDLLELTGYQKTLIHPESGGIANPLTFTVLSAQVIDLVRMQLNVGNQFVQFPLVHTNQNIPVNRGDTIGVRGGAATTDPPPTANITTVIPHIDHFGSVAFGTANFDVEAVLSFLWWSDRAVLESVISLVPYLRDQVAFGHARAIDRGCMSGDIKGRTQAAAPTGHMDDFGGTMPIRDARTLWNGLRRIGANYLINGGAIAFDGDLILDMMRQLGVYGLVPSDLRCWVSPGPMYDMLQDDIVRTIDVFGPEATVKSGTIAAVHGVQLLATAWIPTDQDATSSYSTAIGTSTSAVMANVRRFGLGQLNTIDIETTRHAPMLTTIIQATGYLDFVPFEAIDANQIFATGATVPLAIMRNLIR